jgi:uncharacterized membrane protein
VRYALFGFLALAGCPSPQPVANDAAPATDAPPDPRPISRSPGATGAPCEGSDTYAGFGDGFVRNYCLRCHSRSLTGDARMGTPPGSNFDTLADLRPRARLLDTYAGAGPMRINTYMPLDEQNTPSVAERDRWSRWLACGLPE